VDYDKKGKETGIRFKDFYQGKGWGGVTEGEAAVPQDISGVDPNNLGAEKKNLRE